MNAAAGRGLPAETTSRGIIVLLCVFLVLIGGIIAFARGLVANIASANPAANTLALAVAVGLPAALFVIAVVQFVRLLRQRSQRLPGAAIKLRLTAFLVLVAVLSAGPQAVLSVTFITTAMGTWFSASIGDTLKAAESVTVDAWDEKVENLRAFSEGPHAPGLVADFTTAPERTWRIIQGMNRGISALQVFGAGGRELAFRGDARAKLSDPRRLAGAAGVQPREDLGDVTVLRSVRTLPATGRTAVFSTVVPADLSRSARQLTESMTIFNQVDRYRELFQYVLIAFFFIFSLPIFLITALVSLLLTERIISPIVHLEEATRRVAEGDFSFRILTRSRDELATLVDSFNVMVAELEGSRRTALAAERITAWQEIAQRLAHEIRNPLTPIKLSAQRIVKKHGEGSEDFDRILYPAAASIIREVEGLERLLAEFSDFARLPDPAPEPVELRQLLAEVASTYAHLSGKVEIDLREVAPGTVLTVDRAQMRRVFANLFTNAIQAMPGGGRLSVSTVLVRKAHGQFHRVAVRDTGPGIPEADRERIFDPYYTTKPDGTGLGLAIVRRIVFDHGGSVWAESAPGAGATFWLDLPAGGRP